MNRIAAAVEFFFIIVVTLVGIMTGIAAFSFALHFIAELAR